MRIIEFQLTSDLPNYCSILKLKAMRLTQTVAALLLFSSLFFSCTVDPIDDDDTINQIEDIQATGDESNPPDDDKGIG